MYSDFHSDRSYKMDGREYMTSGKNTIENRLELILANLPLALVLVATSGTTARILTLRYFRLTQWRPSWRLWDDIQHLSSDVWDGWIWEAIVGLLIQLLILEARSRASLVGGSMREEQHFGETRTQPSGQRWPSSSHRYPCWMPK